MGTPCALCISPLRSAASSMRQLQATDEEISASCGIPVEVVVRHFAHCLTQVSGGENEPLSGTDPELRALLRDAEENYHSSVLSGNQASAASSLNVRLRILSALGARELLREARQTSDAGFDASDPDTWSAAQKTFLLAISDAMVADHEKLVGTRRRAEKNMRRRARRQLAQKTENQTV